MAGLSPEIKFNYENLENYRKSVVTNGSYLGRDFNEGKKDVKSTIVVNANAHEAIDLEKEIRMEKQRMTTQVSANIAIMRKHLMETEGTLQQKYEKAFQHAESLKYVPEMPSNANGTTP